MEKEEEEEIQPSVDVQQDISGAGVSCVSYTHTHTDKQCDVFGLLIQCWLYVFLDGM